MGADTVTQGPPTPDQINGAQGIVLDAVNNTLYTYGQSGTAAVVQGRLASLGIQTALSNITTAQTLLSYAFGPGALNVVGRTFRVSGNLIYSTTAANVATLTIALKLGGVTLGTFTTGATNTAASTNLQVNFSFTATVLSVGASGTLVCTGLVDANLGTTTSGAITPYLVGNSGPSSAVNLLSAETLTVTLAASAAVPSAQLLNGAVELLS